MKKVSIIVPVYNVYKYIDKCLDSLVGQTLDNIEVIVVNDGSPDNSQEVIDRYVEKYPKIVKSFVKENGGQGSARNYGLEQATGEYIGYVDSDDYVDIHMFEELYNKAKANDADMAICTNYVIYENSDNIKIDKLFLETEDDKLNALFNRPGMCTRIFKRELLKEFKFRCKVWYEDMDFVTKVVIKSKKVVFVDKPLYYYLLREGSTMNNSNIKRNLEILEAFDDIIDYLKSNKIYKRYQDEVTYLAIYNIYIAAVVRVINIGGCESRDIINKLVKYMYDNFSDFKSNKYLYLLERNKRIIYNLINLKMYWMVKLIFKIKNR